MLILIGFVCNYGRSGQRPRELGKLVRTQLKVLRTQVNTKTCGPYHRWLSSLTAGHE